MLTGSVRRIVSCRSAHKGLRFLCSQRLRTPAPSCPIPILTQVQTTPTMAISQARGTRGRTGAASHRHSTSWSLPWMPRVKKRRAMSSGLRRARATRWPVFKAPRARPCDQARCRSTTPATSFWATPRRSMAATRAWMAPSSISSRQGSGHLVGPHQCGDGPQRHN